MARVLIADDEEDLAAVWRKALELEGHEVTTCHDGDKAARLIDTQHYDLVITDIVMPGKNGFLLTKFAAMTNNGTYVIAVSGQATRFEDLDTRREVLKEGAVKFMPKPVDVFELVDIVNQISGKG